MKSKARTLYEKYPIRITERAVEEIRPNTKEKLATNLKGIRTKGVKQMKSKARMMFKKYPKLFMAMYLHSLEADEGHPDDNSVIYSKLMSNAQGKTEPYWTPESTDMEPIYEDLRKLVPEPEEAK